MLFRKAVKIVDTASGGFAVALRTVILAASRPGLGHFCQVTINMQFGRAVLLFRLDFRDSHFPHLPHSIYWSPKRFSTALNQ
jgi:hypothetical protein